MDEILTDIGTDINSSWSFDEFGDLKLVNNTDNIVQAITNRLNCLKGNMDLYYIEYGSILQNFIGWRKENDTLDFIKIEVESCLQQDPRLVDYDVELSFNSVDNVVIDLNIYYDDETDLSLSLVLNENGEVVIDDGS